jgi:PAS domain S-box-containing protein
MLNTADTVKNTLAQTRLAALPTSVYDGVNSLSMGLKQIRKQVSALEEERRNLRVYSKIAQVVNSSLDLDVVLQIVMDTIIRLTGAERGFLMLKSENAEMTMRVARNWEQESVEDLELTISKTVIYKVANTGQPILTTNAQEDPRFGNQDSVINYNLRSILCVPLNLKTELMGVIYADNRIRSGLFTQKELDLLTAFANQAAVAIENARLFASVRKTLEEVTDLKNLMDNVFASIASGVLTADLGERVMLCNRAASNILGRTSGELVGLGLTETLESLAPELQAQINQVMKTDQAVIGLEMSSNMPSRGQVDLRLSMTPLKDFQQTTQGVAIVMEDLTEKKKLEAQRRLFERMVSPAVIDQLNPDSVALGGQKRTISIVFADIRGFTSFSENTSPEELVAVLNRYLAAAADAILSEEGTIDKFMGDAVMSWFNAPLPQPDHALRAVRAALKIKEAVLYLHDFMPEKYRLSFGVGINTGEAILGLVGSERRLEYTAISDSVNTAKRVQENSSANQILMTKETYKLVADMVIVRPMDAIIAKGKREPVIVYEVLGLRD